MKINETLITVSPAYVGVNREFKMGDDVSLTIDGEITGIKDESNFDGTYNRIYKVKGRLSYENKRSHTP